MGAQSKTFGKYCSRLGRRSVRGIPAIISRLPAAAQQVFKRPAHTHTARAERTNTKVVRVKPSLFSRLRGLFMRIADSAERGPSWLPGDLLAGS